MTSDALLQQFDVIADAPHGIQNLREMILQLAVRGKLVPQDPNGDPASALLKRIAAAKDRLFADGKIGKPTPLAPIREDDARSQLPDRWSWARLAELGEFCGGSTPSKGNTSYWGKGVPWVSPKDMKSDFITSSEDEITQRALDETRIRLVPPRSLLIVTRSGILRRTLPVGINTMCCTVNQDLKVLIPYVTGIEEYLRILLRGHEAVILRELVKGGMTVQSVMFDQFERYAFPFPPLREQRCIVAKVDELMLLCDKLERRQQRRAEARTRLNRSALHQLTTANGDAEFAAHWHRLSENFHMLYDTPETVAELRQAVLQLAVLGKLVSQDPNDEPASVLLDRVAAEKAAQLSEAKVGKQEQYQNVSDEQTWFPLPNGWRRVRAGELLSFVTSGSRGWARYYSDSGALFLRIGNLNYNSVELDLSSIQRVKPPPGAEGLRTRVEPGDILISITGDTGMVGLAPQGFEEAYINQHVALARPSGEIHADWLARYCTSPLAREYLLGAQRGIKNSLGLEDIRSIPVLLPPVVEQHRIMAKLNEIMALCDTLEIQLKHARIESARVAISTVLHLMTA